MRYEVQARYSGSEVWRPGMRYDDDGRAMRAAKMLACSAHDVDETRVYDVDKGAPVVTFSRVLAGLVAL